MRAVRALLGAALLATFVAVGVAAPASASCLSPPRTSPAAFTGVVVELTNAGRVATVRTDAGQTVTVAGTDAGDPSAITTVDRSFVLGARYEFHPINDASPYQDNACTATRLIADPPAGTSPGGHSSPVGGGGTAAAAAGGAAVLAAVAVLLILIAVRARRSASRATPRTG
jgi:hypothetical protein